MNWTIKDATVKAFHYQDLESLTAHVIAFVLLFGCSRFKQTIDGEEFDFVQQLLTEFSLLIKSLRFRSVCRDPGGDFFSGSYISASASVAGTWPASDARV